MILQIISTGGTFNKIYNEATGLFDIDKSAKAPREITNLSRGNLECDYLEIIHKDSNDFTDSDRALLQQTIQDSPHANIIVIHGTDTMSISANYLAKNLPHSQKRVVFVGAMKPFNVQKDEAIFNLASAIGFLNASVANGIYISMHGLVLPHDKIQKDKKAGIFKKQ